MELVSDATMTVGITLSRTQPLTVGAQYDNTVPFQGDLAEIFVARGSAAVASAARLALRQALAAYYGITLP